MQKIFISLSLLTFILTACSKNDDLSDGYGNFDAHAEVIVSAQATGEILSFDINEGDHLNRGKILGQIDTIDLHLKKIVLVRQKESIASQLKDIRATIAVQQQQLEINLTNQRRIQNLYKNQAATQKQLDDINGLVDLNKKQISATRAKRDGILSKMQSVDAQIAQVNEAIDKCSIKNPINGTVLVKYAEKGELATPGKPLYKIANLQTLELKAYIIGSDLNRLKIGKTVKVYYDKNKKENFSIPGTVTWISSQAEFTPKTIQTKEERVNLVYAVKILVDNDGSIKIGMPGEFKIVD
ncbi:MAG: HlyD family efflux transporter periplasmic adaptor subunit [Chlorobi bacterium]|nr:HlyD family efflux transporter periplasmic adaptor subunit [Chlorobiota bacterium]